MRQRNSVWFIVEVNSLFVNNFWIFLGYNSIKSFKYSFEAIMNHWNCSSNPPYPNEREKNDNGTQNGFLFKTRKENLHHCAAENGVNSEC